MPLKTLSTVAVPEGDRDALETAIACARRWSAHLDVCCLSDRQIDMPAILAPEIAATAAILAEETAEEIKAIEARVEKRLTGEAFGWGLMSPIRYPSDFARQIAATHRFSDLAILHASGSGLDPLMQGVTEALLYHTRVPILLAPGPTDAAFERVALAWDGSDVALAAVRAALPILGEAGSIEIVTVDPDSGTSGHDLAVMLDRHGIEVDVSTRPRSGKRIADALAEHVQDRNADLLVMGAYGHRRLREVLLGGVTRMMLDAVPVPLLLAR